MPRRDNSRSARARRTSPPKQALETHKLQKVLAQAGLGSRREMELWIESGKITVNGETAVVGARVSADDRIELEGRPLRIRSSAKAPRVLIYHKPEGEIVSRDDPRGRPSVFEKVPAIRNGKWIAIGRLDFNTCGLLIFTDSGDLANRMMHPRFEVEREYAVRIMGRVESQHIERMLAGIQLADGLARCVSVELRGGEASNQWCHVVLKEGRHRIVRRMFEKLGLTISRLMRVRFGAIALPPRLKRGQLEELEADEVKRLLAWFDAAERAREEPAGGARDRRAKA